MHRDKRERDDSDALKRRSRGLYYTLFSFSSAIVVLIAFKSKYPQYSLLSPIMILIAMAAAALIMIRLARRR